MVTIWCKKDGVLIILRTLRSDGMKLSTPVWIHQAAFRNEQLRLPELLQQLLVVLILLLARRALSSLSGPILNFLTDVSQTMAGCKSCPIPCRKLPGIMLR